MVLSILDKPKEDLISFPQYGFKRKMFGAIRKQENTMESNDL